MSTDPFSRDGRNDTSAHRARCAKQKRSLCFLPRSPPPSLHPPTRKERRDHHRVRANNHHAETPVSGIVKIAGRDVGSKKKGADLALSGQFPDQHRGDDAFGGCFKYLSTLYMRRKSARMCLPVRCRLFRRRANCSPGVCKSKGPARRPGWARRGSTIASTPRPGRRASRSGGGFRDICLGLPPAPDLPLPGLTSRPLSRSPPAGWPCHTPIHGWIHYNLGCRHGHASR